MRGYDRHGLLVETWHRGDGSKDCELAAWKARYDRGEVSRVEVIDRQTYRMETYPPWPPQLTGQPISPAANPLAGG